MDVEHADPGLEQLEKDIRCTRGLDQKLIRQFRRLMLLIRNVPNESELYKYPSRHFEKLKGKRDCQYSLRLDDKWRLIVEVAKRPRGNCLRIIEITNHYR